MIIKKEAAGKGLNRPLNNEHFKETFDNINTLFIDRTSPHVNNLYNRGENNNVYRTYYSF
jgi:hypothetical protein